MPDDLDFLIRELAALRQRVSDLERLDPLNGSGYPTLSGLTAGQPLRATGAAAAAFGALDLANANAVTGALPMANLALTIAAATYTPTLTNSANIDASTAALLKYYRVGDLVTVFGSVEIDPTAAASTTLGISLPIASNFGAVGDCAGTITRGTGGQGHVSADTTNDRASAVFVATATGNATYYLHFSYRII